MKSVNYNGKLGYLTVFIMVLLLWTRMRVSDNSPSNYGELHWYESRAIGSNDVDEIRRLGDIHLAKARQESNAFEMANAYFYKFHAEEEDTGLIYADSIIHLTQEDPQKYYPTVGYILRGNIYFDRGRYEEALEAYVKAYEYALLLNNTDHLRDISTAIAHVKNNLGYHQVAADLFQSSLQMLMEKKNYRIIHHREYLHLQYNLALTYLNLQKMDSARRYVQNGINAVRPGGDNNDILDFILLGAEVDFRDGNLERAGDTLLKYVGKLNTENQIKSFQLLSSIKEKTGKLIMARRYAEKKDSLQRILESGAEIKEAPDDIGMQAVDNRNNKFSSQVYSEWKKGWIVDVPKLKYKIRVTEAELRRNKVIALSFASLAIMGLVGVIYLLIQNKDLKKRLSKLKAAETEISAFAEPAPPVTHSVPSSVAETILLKLAHMERDPKVWGDTMNQDKMAKKLGTNSTYLSAVINGYKQCSFSNYVKEMRIKSAIKRLEEEPYLQKYKFDSLAKTFGFKTGSAFSQAFQKVTGSSLRDFINGLQEKEKFSGRLLDKVDDL